VTHPFDVRRQPLATYEQAPRRLVSQFEMDGVLIRPDQPLPFGAKLVADIVKDEHLKLDLIQRRKALRR